MLCKLGRVAGGRSGIISPIHLNAASVLGIASEPYEMLVSMDGPFHLTGLTAPVHVANAGASRMTDVSRLWHSSVEANGLDPAASWKVATSTGVHLMGVYPGDVAHLSGHPAWGSLLAAGQPMQRGESSFLTAIRVGPLEDEELIGDFTATQLPHCEIGIRVSVRSS